MTLKGADDFSRALRGFVATVETQAADICAQSAENVRSQVVVDINTQKANPGYVVPKGATGRKAHVPAPAGGPPNADTGNLSARYTTTLQHLGPKIAAKVVAGTLYAFWLEFGTSRMAARPHLLPRFNEAKPRFEKRLKDVLNSAAKQANSTGARKR